MGKDGRIRISFQTPDLGADLSVFPRVRDGSEETTDSNSRRHLSTTPFYQLDIEEEKKEISLLKINKIREKELSTTRRKSESSPGSFPYFS